MTTLAYINQIPSAHEFKRSIGRTGFSGMFKKHDRHIDSIYAKLKAVESIRNVISLPVIHRLRDVRVPANVLLNGYGTPALEAVTCAQVVAAINARIEVIALNLYGPGKQTQVNEMDDQTTFNAFYDDVAMNGGGGVGRRLDAHYKYERVTTSHHTGELTSTWLKSGSSLGLNTWIDTVHRWAQQDGAANKPMYAPGSPGPQGVQYLDAAQRANYAITVRGGQARDPQNQLRHTGGYHSQSGTGWGIYTVSFQGDFYVGEHSLDNFHHSSFFSGAPVLAAGEIMINGGRIIGLTNKTGHYKAGPAELAAALSRLGLSGGVDLQNVAVSDPFRQSKVFYRGDDVLAAGGDVNAVTQAPIPAPPALQ